ncbi:putative beta-lysine N-acetyltransferase [Maribellus sp. YY47]|uniref:putative beta-lysine N-acetyltransferase n=1 Tax=Maribellus sp. YY47 TaxID=2929486 RepID=UPI002001B67C|nr:putative beta-lysine N-acetyltransferase [Maribellus sp. YY47]MCK3684871.1 putative beta-lysine N-acetyltransferase [Maribellus sp. YY47]
MQDKIEKIGIGTWIQHGNLNQRVYLMKLAPEDCPSVIEEMNQLARTNRYSKIFCKVPQRMSPYFIANGFMVEAQIPRFFKGEETVFFMSKFLSSDRLLNIESEQLNELSNLLNQQDKAEKETNRQSTFQVRRLKEEDCESISAVYSTVFESYPFPIQDPAYISHTMQNAVQYFGVEADRKLIALASAEVDEDALNAEMTDFATLPEYRGKGLAQILLRSMESEMKKDGIKTLYTIARLNSAGMNKTFLKLRYYYCGTSLKNTNISGKIESMNIYYKHI